MRGFQVLVIVRTAAFLCLGRAGRGKVKHGVFFTKFDSWPVLSISHNVCVCVCVFVYLSVDLCSYSDHNKI